MSRNNNLQRFRDQSRQIIWIRLITLFVLYGVYGAIITRTLYPLSLVLWSALLAVAEAVRLAWGQRVVSYGTLVLTFIVYGILLFGWIVALKKNQFQSLFEFLAHYMVLFLVSIIRLIIDRVDRWASKKLRFYRT